jgi:hypothetical protein
MTIDNFIIDNNNPEYESVDVLDMESNVELDESIHIIEIEESESTTVDTFDAFNAMGEPNEQLRHQLLNGRDAADQHPITAITGLREKLDDIEALKTVYSDKKQSADYYQWEDDNVIQENRIGLFVALCEDINKIRVCTEDDDIFGVVVDAAGFIGGQSDIARDYKYGLVATNGVVHVRCESDVAANDFVIPNDYGMAKKTHSDYGCKVVALHEINGLIYAAILLDVSANQLYMAGVGINYLNNRVGDVEKNVVVAINEANKANNKIDELDLSDFKKSIDNSIKENNDKINNIIKTDSEYKQQIADAIEKSEEAKTIANSAIASAGSFRDEAVAKANEALEEIQTVRNEMIQDISNINTDIDNSMLELQKTKEDLEETREELKNSIDDNIADFKKEVKDNYATTESLAAFKTDTGIAISSVRQEASDTYATKTELTSFETETTDAIVGVEEKVDDNSAQLTTLASFEYGNNIELRPFTNLHYEIIDETWSEEEKEISKKYYVSSEKKYYYYNNGWTSTEKLSVDINGITFTDNNDGTIIARGVANNTAGGFIDFILVENKILPEGEYEVSGCPNGSLDTYCILLKIQNGETITYKQIMIRRGDPNISEERFRQECRFTIESGDSVSIYIRIKSEFEISEDGLEFNPQLKQYFSGISGLKNQVAKNGASIDMLSNFSSDSGTGSAGLIAKVSDHDSKLSTLASWKSEVANDDGTLKIAESVAAIKQQADTQGGTIQSIVTWQENLEVGGRNLVLDSEVKEESSIYGFAYRNLSETLQPGETYVFSVNGHTNNNGENNDGGYLRCYIFSKDDWQWFSYIDIKQDTDKTLSIVFVAPDSISEKSIGVGSFYYPKQDAAATGTVTINWYKLEKGNIATDWSPAPEDTTKAIASVTSKVNENGANINSLTNWQGEARDSMARIEQKADENGASITSFVSTIDKYSVGEYSQAYGLTQEQAQNILKKDMIYIPTKHGDNLTHEEKYFDTEEINYFTEGRYYTWNGNDWDESSAGTVVFSSQEPDDVEYWYIDSDTAPEGYEPKALYKYEDEQWKKVNILDGNVVNRAISMIQQRTNKISLDVTSVQGDVASHKQWIDNEGSQIQDLVTWSKGGDENGEQFNLATIKQTADNAGATVAQVVGTILTEYDKVETWDEADKDTTKVYYAEDDEKFWFYRDGVWNSTNSPTEAGLELNAASIVAAINNQTGETAINLNANRINLEGAITANKTFSIDTDGYMTATGGTVGGWIVEGSKPEEFGNVVFIGDSYTKNKAYDGNSTDTNIIKEYKKGWPYYCADSLGISSSNYFDAGKSGSGFCFHNIDTNPNIDTFQKCLEKMFNEYKDDAWRKNITHIVIGGGFNDATTSASEYCHKNLSAAIDAFAAKLKSLCSTYGIRPKVYLFALGKSCGTTSSLIQKNSNLIKVYDLYETKAKLHGWKFYDLHNTWQGVDGGLSNYVGKDTPEGSVYDNANFPDGDTTHPNTTGLISIGSTVASYLKYEKGRLYNPPAGYEFKDKHNTNVSSTLTYGNSGFYLSNRPGDWAIEIGPKAYSYENVGGSSNPHRPFLVGQNGNLWAQNARISGTINATSGKIGGWSITESVIGSTSTTKNSKARFYLASASDSAVNWIRADDAGGMRSFSVTKDGYLYARGADISGTITATSGKIGGWDITDDYLESTVYEKKIDENGKEIINANKKLYLASAGSTATNWIRADDENGNWSFLVTKDGYLYAKGANISGKITATSGSFSRSLTVAGKSISDWISDEGKIYSADLTKGSIKYGDYFSVSDDGKVQISNDTGFLTMGGSTKHPYVSSLNVAGMEGAITFRTGTGQDDIGKVFARINAAEDDASSIGYSLQIETGYNIWINKHKCITGQIKIQTSLTTSIYLAFNRGFIVGVDDEPHKGFDLITT